jgi:hypothetical protein
MRLPYNRPHSVHYTHTWPAHHARETSGLSIVLLIPMLSIFIMIETALIKTTLHYVFQKSSVSVAAPPVHQDVELILTGP